ncbi:MAG TPA: T9SS type A sorting domain-containing protein, partial [Cytophaga sp.]|nr:T9SS type A sorting domain-containing protein [Cytophaga sp.]
KSKTAAGWSSYNNGLSNWNVTSVTAAGNKIYIGTDGTGVFVSDSTLASIHWSVTASTQTAITYTTLMNLNGMKIQAMGTYAGYVWASYEGGLLATSDQGATWIAGGTQFNLPSFTDVTKITFVTTRVFVSTENNGLYSNALSEIPTVATGIFDAVAINNTALKVAPNPSNGSFTLNTENVSGNITEIVIYDYAGNVKDTFDGSQTQFSLNYKQGMYVVFLKTDTDAVYTQKIVVQ